MAHTADLEETIQKQVGAFRDQRDNHEKACAAIHRDVVRWLEGAGIKVVAVTSRVKTVDSLERKLREKPGHAIEDEIGIRILAHIRSDLRPIEKVMRAHLSVDDDSYVNKSRALGSSSFGYRSVQFIAEVPAAEPFANIIEEMRYEGPKAEIQIRTVLEHAWADLDHLRYRNKELRNAVTDRSFAITAALLEQADQNLEEIREVLTGRRPTPELSKEEFMRLSPKRFIETNPLSIEVDKEITAALDLPTSLVEKYEREVIRSVYIAGWENEEAVADAMGQYRDLIRRAAIACAPVDRYMLIPDSLGYQEVPAESFPGIGLYWLGIVVAFGIKRLDRNETSTIGVGVGRMREWATVIQYLIGHPDEPALLVRERYLKVAAKPYADRREFKPIDLR